MCQQLRLRGGCCGSHFIGAADSLKVLSVAISELWNYGLPAHGVIRIKFGEACGTCTRWDDEIVASCEVGCACVSMNLPTRDTRLSSLLSTILPNCLEVLASTSLA